MKNILLILCFLLIGQMTIAQNASQSLSDSTINILIGSFYERGNDQIDFWGFSGGVGIYKGLYVGGYWQSGKLQEVDAVRRFEVNYRHGGPWIAYLQNIGDGPFTLLHGFYFGLGRSTAEQSRPISYVDAVEKFYVLTPEIGLGVRIPRSWVMLSLDGGYHRYIDREFDDQPLGYGGFDLNSFYGKIQLRLGIF